MILYSIGHSNADIDAFTGLLKQHGILALVDTRSKPYSRFLPHFNQGNLGIALDEVGVQYVYLGDRIGGRPSNPLYYFESGKVDYGLLAMDRNYKAGIEALIDLGKQRPTAFMCAEADYHRCHRYWLITRSLLEKNLEVRHVLHSGKLASSDISEFVPEQPSLFG
jgi:uncharacterized protein (DUF488 family)